MVMVDLGIMSSQSLPFVLFFFLLLLISTYTAPSVDDATCNSGNKAVLLKIKQALGNPSSLSYWTPDSDCCRHGWAIGCDSASRVTGLVLGGKPHITGPIPDAIADLPYLVNLQIDGF